MEALAYYIIFIFIVLQIDPFIDKSGPNTKIEETPGDILDDIYK